MPRYRVSVTGVQREYRTYRLEVDADCPADAITAVLNDQGLEVSSSFMSSEGLEYLEDGNEEAKLIPF